MRFPGGADARGERSDVSEGRKHGRGELARLLALRRPPAVTIAWVFVCVRGVCVGVASISRVGSWVFVLPWPGFVMLLMEFPTSSPSLAYECGGLAVGGSFGPVKRD